MSDNNEATQVEERHAFSALLESLIDMADHGINTSVTLSVRGLVVAGELANAKQYFEGIANAFSAAEGSGAELAKVISEKMLKVSSEIDTTAALPPPRIVHLRDARVWGGNSGSTLHVGWWSGALASVDGFALGTAI